jgi:hypothetical protein
MTGHFQSGALHSWPCCCRLIEIVFPSPAQQNIMPPNHVSLPFQRHIYSYGSARRDSARRQDYFGHGIVIIHSLRSALEGEVIGKKSENILKLYATGALVYQGGRGWRFSNDDRIKFRYSFSKVQIV